MINQDASCQNCAFYTEKGTCLQATNMAIDYSQNTNPHCWHWARKKPSLLKQIRTKIQEYRQKKQVN